MNGVQVASMFGVLELRDTMTAGLDRAEKGFKRLGQTSTRAGQQITARLDSISNGFGRMASAMAPVSAAFGALTVLGLKSYGDFDDALSEIAARTGATATEMDSVRAMAIKMGQDTAYSSTQAAEAMLQLLASGYNLDQTFQALPATLNAAAAGAMDLGYTADVVTDALAMWGLGADQATMVADTLARGAGASSAEINDLAQGLANVGPLAAQFGLSLNDTVAILSAFSERGIKGAEAGTQLRSMLNNMTRDTEDVTGAWEALGISMYDAEGNVRPLLDVFGEMNTRLNDGSYTQEEQIDILKTLGGTYGQMGLAILTGGDAMGEMLALMADQTDAATVAEARLSSLNGMLSQLKSSFQTLLIVAMQPFVENGLKPLISMATEWLNTATQWATLNPELAGQFVKLAAVLGVVAPFAFTMAKVFSVLSYLVGGMANPVFLIGVAMFGAYKAFKAFVALSPKLQGNLTAITGILKTMAATTLDITRAFWKVGWVIGSALLELLPLGDWARDAAEWFGDLSSAVVMFTLFLARDLYQIQQRVTAWSDHWADTWETLFSNDLLTGPQQFFSIFSFMLQDLFGQPFAGIAERIRGGLGAINDAFSGLADTVRDAIGAALDLIPSIDVSGVKSAIAGSLSNMSFVPTDFTFAPIGTFIANHLLTIIQLALGLVFSPAAFAIGLGKLIVAAFDADLLGFRSALESSPVVAKVQDGLGVIWDAVSNFFTAGEGTGGAGAVSWLSGLSSTIVDGLKPLYDWLTGEDVAGPIESGLGKLKDGIQGFIQAFQGTETGNIVQTFKDIGEVALVALASGITILGNALKPLIEATAQYAGGTLGAIGDALPGLGSAISSFVTAIDRLLGGDYKGALVGLGEGLWSLATTAGGFVWDWLTNLVASIETLTGLDITGAIESLKGIGADMLAAIGEGIDNINFGNITILGIVGGLGMAVTTFWDLIKGVGVNILEAIAGALEGVADWAKTKVIMPIANALIEAIGGEDVWTKLREVGGKVLGGIASGFGNIALWVWNEVISPILKSLVHLPGYIVDAISGAVSGILDVPLLPEKDVIGGAATSAYSAHQQTRAAGGWASGWSMVGEEGPELVNFGSGARVYSNPDSQKMLGGGSQTIQIILDGAVLLDATVNEANRRNLQLVVA